MSLMDEFKKIIHPYDDEDDDYEEDVGRDSEPTYFEPREPREPRESSRRKEVPAEERRNKVVNIHATTQLKVVLVKPERFENASEIADHLQGQAHRGAEPGVHQQGYCPAPDRLPVRRGLRRRGQDQEGGCQYLYHHALSCGYRRAT